MKNLFGKLVILSLLFFFILALSKLTPKIIHNNPNIFWKYHNPKLISRFYFEDNKIYAEDLDDKLIILNKDNGTELKLKADQAILEKLRKQNDNKREITTKEARYVISQECIIDGCWSDKLSSYDLKTGRERWSIVNNVPNKIFSDNGRIYYISKDYLYSVE